MLDPKQQTTVPTEAELANAIANQLEDDLLHANMKPIAGGAGGGSIPTRPAYPSANDMSTKWQEGVKNGAQHWVDGIQSPRADFRQAAINNNAGWKAGVQAAVAQDKFVKAMNNVDPNEALSIAVAVGANGYMNGALARTAKHLRIMGKVAPLMAAAVTTVRNLPAVSDTDREARAIAMIRAARAVGKTLAGV
jgi:hypothetical protein